MTAYYSMLDPKQLGATCLSTLCLGINWFSYVWALKHREYLAASLAYYICPLLTLAAAAFFFRERISTRQIAAEVDMLRMFIRLAVDIKVLPLKKAVPLQERLDEIGRMLGRWIKSVRQR